MNPSPFRPIERSILRKTSILVCNEVEASCIAQAYGLDWEAGSGSRLAERLMQEGLDILIVTRGGEGAIAYPRAGPPFTQPAFPVAVVDTLGAGDAFSAGLLAGLIEGRSLAGSLQWAATCGALVCRGAGVLQHLPVWSELQRVLSPADQSA